MELQPIINESVVDTIVHRISESILSGAYKAGEKIPTEMELAQKLNVGRNSIREAIKMLTAMGIFETRKGSGTYVATEIKSTVFNPLLFSLILDHGTSDNIYELRVVFETAVVGVVINKITQEEVKILEDCIVSMEGKIKKTIINFDDNHINEIVKEDLKFHNYLLKFTYNPLMERIGQTILNIYNQNMKKTIANTKDLKVIVDAHKMILEAIKNKQTENLGVVIEKSIEEWKSSWK